MKKCKLFLTLIITFGVVLHFIQPGFSQSENDSTGVQNHQHRKQQIRKMYKKDLNQSVNMQENHCSGGGHGFIDENGNGINDNNEEGNGQHKGNHQNNGHCGEGSGRGSGRRHGCGFQPSGKCGGSKGK